MAEKPFSENEMQKEWIPLTVAARRIGVSHAKLSRMARQNRIATQKNPFDERETLVDMTELQQIFKRP